MGTLFQYSAGVLNTTGMYTGQSYNAMYVSPATVSCGALNGAGILGWHMLALLYHVLCVAVCHTNKTHAHRSKAAAAAHRQSRAEQDLPRFRHALFVFLS